jgi:hypothetical protein
LISSLKISYYKVPGAFTTKDAWHTLNFHENFKISSALTSPSRKFISSKGNKFALKKGKLQKKSNDPSSLALKKKERGIILSLVSKSLLYFVTTPILPLEGSPIKILPHMWQEH